MFDKEFKVMAITIFTVLKKKVGDLFETFNKYIETIEKKKNQR